MKNAIDVKSGAAKHIFKVCSIGQQPPGSGKIRILINGRYIGLCRERRDQDTTDNQKIVRQHNESAFWLACERADDCLDVSVGTNWRVDQFELKRSGGGL